MACVKMANACDFFTGKIRLPEDILKIHSADDVAKSCLLVVFQIIKICYVMFTRLRENVPLFEVGIYTSAESSSSTLQWPNYFAVWFTSLVSVPKGFIWEKHLQRGALNPQWLIICCICDLGCMLCFFFTVISSLKKKRVINMHSTRMKMNIWSWWSVGLLQGVKISLRQIASNWCLRCCMIPQLVLFCWLQFKSGFLQNTFFILQEERKIERIANAKEQTQLCRRVNGKAVPGRKGRGENNSLLYCVKRQNLKASA